MECAPQMVMKAPSQPVAAPAPAIDSKSSALSPGLNLVVQSADESGETQAEKPKAEEKSAEPNPPKSTTGQDELTDEEKAQLAKLQARDREVRAHEQAHAAAGAGVAGAPSYTYQQGPDGRQYAVGGEVSVRTTASSSNPRQAIAQLQQVARAALAPASPSGQDRAVAASARAQAAQLQAQLAAESRAKAQEALSNGAEEAQAATSTGAPAERKPLLPELPALPEITKPATGSNDGGAGNGIGTKASVVQPIAASVIAPAATSTPTPGGGAESGKPGIASSIAAYQQQLGQSGSNGSGGSSDSNGIKPIAPAVSGRVISLNA